MLKLSLEIHQPEWKTIFTFPRGTVMKKGRHGLYHDVCGAAGRVEQKYGCYAWAAGVIRYCGCNTKDYGRAEFKSNLHGRVHNYLQNHSGTTNKFVFDKITGELAATDVRFLYLSFESLALGDEIFDYATFGGDRTLVKAVEELLIASYRRIGQCDWNRT